MIGVGYLVLPFLPKLAPTQFVRLLQVLGNSKVENYPPDVLSYLFKNSSEIFSMFEKESAELRIALYNSWPSTFVY